MTDELEREAEEYELKICGISANQKIREAYIAGAEAHSVKWHKVSEQTPTEEKKYLVKLTSGTVEVMEIFLDGNLKPYVVNISVDFYRDIEKWCEIPGVEGE